MGFDVLVVGRLQLALHRFHGGGGVGVLEQHLADAVADDLVAAGDEDARPVLAAQVVELVDGDLDQRGLGDERRGVGLGVDGQVSGRRGEGDASSSGLVSQARNFIAASCSAGPDFCEMLIPAPPVGQT
jgi:hypothetical protein